MSHAWRLIGSHRRGTLGRWHGRGSEDPSGDDRGTFVSTVEQWRPIPGFVGYEVSDQGRVRSYWRRRRGLVATSRLLKQSPNQRGYLRVGLRAGDGKTKIIFVHRLVLLAFVGPAPEGTECRHRDGRPSNNSLGNLQWNTHLVNMGDTVRHGTSGRGGRRIPKCRLWHPLIGDNVAEDGGCVTCREAAAAWRVHHSSSHTTSHSGGPSPRSRCTRRCSSSPAAPLTTSPSSRHWYQSFG